MALNTQNSLWPSLALWRLRLTKLPVFVGICLLWLPLTLWAARDAVVISEKAVIWADPKRSAPLGYARRGKVLRVGDTEREKGQMVTVVVSGKIAYIALEDVQLGQARPNEKSDEVQTTRFQEATRDRLGGYLMFSGTLLQASESKDSKAERDGDTWSFQGGQIKGAAHKDDARLGLSIMGEYLYAGKGKESFRLFELGFGPAFSLINFQNVKLKIEAMLLLVPWAQYDAEPLFTLNGYGAGGLAQASLLLFPSASWGVEGALGLQAIKVFKFKRPEPFEEFSPLFVGAKISAGLVRRF